MTSQREPLKNPKLTVKEVRLLKALVEGKTMGEAGMIATGSTTPQSGATQAGRMLKNVDLQQELAKAFERHSITIDAATRPIADGLQATRSIGFGEDSIEVADHATRLKASGMAFNLMGVNRGDSGGTINNFIIIAKDQRGKYGI